MGNESDIAKRFAKDTANHIIIPLHADGLYRHLRFANPTTSAYWFELATWPGSLAIRGDMGSYVFSRSIDEDMFKFFRGSRINPDYWAGKLPDVNHVKKYSAEMFSQLVTEHFVEAVKCDDAPKGLGKAVREHVLERDISTDANARWLLEDFEYEGFRFDDAWEWDFRDWDWSYLWCCHAIQWGISQYDRQLACAA